MNFEKKIWYDKENTEKRIPISAENLNRIENGIQEAFDEIAYADLKNLIVQKITSSCEWVAPKAKKNLFRVFAVGGGGGGGKSFYRSNSMYAGGGGGGGGYIEISNLEIKKDTKVIITCGAGGCIGEDGGNTTFGSYLSAQGGCHGTDATSEKNPGSGGSGGSGGGGGGVYFDINYNNSELTCSNGGDGSKYGGGGGAGTGYHGTSTGLLRHGSGGTSLVGGDSSECGYGGTKNVIPEAGQIMNGSFISCLFDLNCVQGIREPKTGEGAGGIGSNGGSGVCSGGGGYCGNGGNSSLGGGGGGGYCGNGGNGGGYLSRYSGGGGGGFFSNGGTSNSSNEYAGGGGGFFSNGKDNGVGGDGGVLIMYIKDNTPSEEDNIL